LRLQGDLLLALSPAKISEAERSFQRALEIARKHGALMSELRVAVSLARLWAHTDKADQGRQLLAEVYARFTEGFETRDLIEARELLGMD
jgi:predicted ATPase